MVHRISEPIAAPNLTVIVGTVVTVVARVTVDTVSLCPPWSQGSWSPLISVVTVVATTN